MIVRFANGDSVTVRPCGCIVGAMNRKLEIIAVGNEVLTGVTVNTNAAWLAREAFGIGWETGWMGVVGDDPEAIGLALRQAVGRAGAVLVCGGLGPTEDDLTLAAAARSFGAELIFHLGVMREIEASFQRRGAAMPESNRRQAMIPAGAEALPNPSGTAPGVWWPHPAGVPLIFFPGVPGELQDIWRETVRDRLAKRVNGRVAERWLQVAGISESALMERIAPVTAGLPVEIYPYAGDFQVRLRLLARGRDGDQLEDWLNEGETALRQELGIHCYASGNDELETVIGRLLFQAGQTVAVAESCSGGLVSSRLTDVAGASAWLKLNAVTYADEAKQSFLGLSPELLAAHGAVSEAVARAMAAGIREKAGTDYGLAVTGIAGPSGGSEEKPVGTVHLAVTDGTRTVAERHQGYRQMDRVRLKRFFSQRALDLLRRFILESR